MLNRIKKYTSSTKAKQVFGLYSVNLIGLPLTLITSILLARYLGPVKYGNYKFIIHICTLFASIVTIGFFQAASRALLLNNDSKKNGEIYGATLFLTLLMSVVMTIGIGITAFFYDDDETKSGLYTILPFAFIFLFIRITEVMLRADNKIKLLSRFKIGSPSLYLLATVLLFFLIKTYNVNHVILGYVVSQIVCVIYLVSQLKVSFGNIKTRLHELWSLNKSYGFHVYLGSLFSMGVSHLNPVLVGLFSSDNTGVGFYSIAIAITAPLAMIPVTVATVFYREFTNKNSVPNKVLFATVGLSFLALLLLILIVKPFVGFFYGNEYDAVVPLTLIASIGTLFHGFGDFYNYFFSANGKGKLLRNTSIIVGTGTLLTNLLLVPNHGAYGAAFAKVAGGLIYFMTMLIYYFKMKKQYYD